VLEGLQERGEIDDIFFDYDQADLSSAARETLRANSLHFRNHPEARIVIEGHCDERGTEAYNLALGDNRAQAVYEYLIQLGIPAGRMETISFGEERPFSMGTDERSYAQNRRAHFAFR
jgi:peptidoglycan-associated lipoprotein